MSLFFKIRGKNNPFKELRPRHSIKTLGEIIELFVHMLVEIRIYGGHGVIVAVGGSGGGEEVLIVEKKWDGRGKMD